MILFDFRKNNSIVTGIRTKNINLKHPSFNFYETILSLDYAYKTMFIEYLLDLLLHGLL